MHFWESISLKRIWPLFDISKVNLSIYSYTLSFLAIRWMIFLLIKTKKSTKCSKIKVCSERNPLCISYFHWVLIWRISFSRCPLYSYRCWEFLLSSERVFLQVDTYDMCYAIKVFFFSLFSQWRLKTSLQRYVSFGNILFF